MIGMIVGASAAHTGRTVSTTPLMNFCQPLLPLDTFCAASAISSFLEAPPGRAIGAAVAEKRRAAGRMAGRAARIITVRSSNLAPHHQHWPRRFKLIM